MARIYPPASESGAIEEAVVTPPAVDAAEFAPPAGASRWPARLAAFTIADGLMLLIGGLAALLRLGDLARLPLSAAEAAAALANWQFNTARPPALPVDSPAYFTFTNLVMGLGGDGDAAARLAPALFGVLTVLAVWLWRGRVRPLVWLAAGLFMAVSPLLVAVSRVAGGDAFALFALVVLAVAGTRLAAPRFGGGRRWAVAAGVALGLGLASSPLFYGGLAGLALAGVWMGGAWGEEGSRARVRYIRTGGLAAAITFVLISTSFLLHLEGIGAALRLLPAWLGQFGLPGSWSALASPLLALLRYEPAVAALGVPAVVWSWATGRRGGRFLSLWLGWALAVALLQPGEMSNVAVVLLPGYVLVGVLSAAVAAQRERFAGRPASWPASWPAAVALVGLGALLVVAMGRFVRMNLLTGSNATLLTLAVLAFLLAGMAVILAMAWDSPSARRGALAGLAALLLVWQWGVAWQLSRHGANDPRERWVTTGTSDEVRVMTGLLENLAWQATNSTRDLTVVSLVDSPVLRWYLRGVDDLTVGGALPANTTADVVITPAADDPPALPADYFGADFGLERREIPSATPAALPDVLRWWLFRESGAPTDDTRVILWVRSDIAGE